MAGLPYAQFAQRLREISQTKPKRTTADKLTKLATSGLQGVVDRSPVGNPALWVNPPPPGYVPGSFKNNWFVEIGGITPKIREQPDASGAASLAESRNLSSLRTNPYVIVYIHNSVPYANRIEHGWSSQAPVGVVAVTASYLRTLS